MIHVQGLCINLSGFSVRGVDLDIQPGEFFTLIGPTGSGKTLVLESIAGLVPISAGRIVINGLDVTNLPPEKRAVSLVYQDHSLFPHLSVLQNVTYGQRYQGINPKTGREEALRLLDRLGLARHVDRKPTNLSGGEKQRVAIARALACRPNVLLLDEPLSSLDPQFRAGLRQELKALHQDSGLTVLMVTHDFVDAFTLAQRAGVLRGGQLEQVGTVSDIFRQPSTPFVAEFVGMTNVLPATFHGNRCLFAGQEVALETPPPWRTGFAALHPDDIAVSRTNDFPEDWCVFPGSITRVDHVGFQWVAQIQCEDSAITATVSKSMAMDDQPRNASPIFFGFSKDHLHLMPPVAV